MKQKYSIACLMREVNSTGQQLALLKSKYNIPSLGISNKLLATKVYLDSGLHLKSTWLIPTKYWLAEPLCATPAQHVTDLRKARQFTGIFVKAMRSLHSPGTCSLQVPWNKLRQWEKSGPLLPLLLKALRNKRQGWGCWASRDSQIWAVTVQGILWDLLALPKGHAFRVCSGKQVFFFTNRANERIFLGAIPRVHTHKMQHTSNKHRLVHKAEFCPESRVKLSYLHLLWHVSLGTHSFLVTPSIMPPFKSHCSLRIVSPSPKLGLFPSETCWKSVYFSKPSSLSTLMLLWARSGPLPLTAVPLQFARSGAMLFVWHTASCPNNTL